jgi:glycine cleavage system aminomethyltransferase T/glycine/D-amino acid oxidase-like deaminating enzyme
MTIPEQLANKDLSADVLEPLAEPPDRARVVIVGGGIIGSSIAYHLTKLGLTDVVVLERGTLTNGTTWHAAGLVSQIRGNHALTALTRINADLYESLPAETGIETGLRRHGAVTVARTPGRMTESLYGVAMAQDFDVPVEILTPAEFGELWPAAVTDDLVGAVNFPTDGTVNPGDAALALAKGAKDRGARFVQGVTVTGFTRAADGVRVTGVETDRGTIEAETVVLAAGLWTSELARLAGASVALYPAEHVWVMTEPAEGAREESPFLRDLDGYLYIRHHRGSYVIGAFEPNGKPMAPDLVPTTGFVELGPDWDHFAPVLANARQRLPELETIGFSHYLRAPESFTPDAAFQLGEFPEVPGLWVAAGLNSQGIIYGPGVGMALSEWIVEGHPTYDLTDVDVARMSRWSNTRSWLRERTVESLGGLYEMHWPGKQPITARGIRRIPLWDRMRAAGASFGQAAGWERANWFEPGAVDPEVTYDFVEASWLPSVREEVRATREAVALYDLSTYSKFMVEGASALGDLQRLCTANIDVPIGRVVYTMICNERGGIEMDPTVTRMADDRFLVLAPTLAQRRTEMLLRNGVAPGTVVTDVTSGWATLHLAGPRSRELLARLTDEELTNEAFPFLSAREIEVGWTPAWAFRVSFTGELGWELSVPTEFVSDLYDRIVVAGDDLGLRHAGAFAFDAARLERGFRSWGHDIGQLDDPFSAGLGFAVHLRGDGDFVGREALTALKDGPRDRRLVSVHAPGVTLWHGESLLHGDDRRGHITSAGVAPTLSGGSVGLAWVHGELDADGWSVQVGDRLVPATVQLEPFHDPKGDRTRA